MSNKGHGRELEMTRAVHRGRLDNYRSNRTNYRTDRTDDGRTPPGPPLNCFRLRRYGRRIFRQKSSNGQKIARMARILMIFGPFEPHRRQLEFPKILNERKIIESIEPIDSIERSRDRSDRSTAAVFSRSVSDTSSSWRTCANSCIRLFSLSAATTASVW